MEAKPERFTAAVEAALAEEGESRSWLADRLAVSKGTVSRMLAGRRPSADMLRGLCGPVWREADRGLYVLEAWCLDEVEAAGRSVEEIDVRALGSDRGSRKLAEQLRLIREWLPGNPDVAAVIEHLAEVAAREMEARNSDRRHGD